MSQQQQQPVRSTDPIIRSSEPVINLPTSNPVSQTGQSNQSTGLFGHTDRPNQSTGLFGQTDRSNQSTGLFGQTDRSSTSGYGQTDRPILSSGSTQSDRPILSSERGQTERSSLTSGQSDRPILSSDQGQADRSSTSGDSQNDRPILSSNPVAPAHAHAPSLVSDNKAPTRYVKDIKVVLSGSKDDMPKEALVEFNGRTNDLNEGFEGLFGKLCWLVPEYTADASQAATGFYVMAQDDAIDGRVDIACHTGGKYRYLVALHEQGKPKLTDAMLFRTNDKGFQPTCQGYNGFSKDINDGRGGDFLYIAWHSA